QNTAVSMQAIGNQRVLLPTGPVTGTAADGSTATVNDLQQHSRNWSDIMTSTDCDYTLSGPSGYMRGGGFTCRADQDPAPNKNRICVGWRFIGRVDGSETAEIGGYTVAATVRAKAAFYFPALTGGVGDNNSKLYYFPLATGFDVKSFYIIPLVIPPLP